MKPKLLVGLVLIAAIVGAVFFYQKNYGIHFGPVKASDTTKAKGPANAKITIVGYSDFQCPACQAAEPAVSKLLKEYPQDVRFIFRHFPLKMHLWSSVAHQAAECANRNGKFWEFHDKLFSTQKEWSNPMNPTERFLAFAKELNLNLDQFATCLSDKEITEMVQEERRQGEELKIQSTPTFFVNGERLVGPVELQMKGESIIRAALGLPAKPMPQTPAPQSSASAAAPANAASSHSHPHS